MRRAEPGFDLDLRYGEAGERQVRQYLDWWAEGSTLLEVKRKTYEDGCFFVETYCDKGRQGDYSVSGINVTQAHAWAFLVSETGIVLIVPAAHIRAAFRNGYGKQLANNRGDCPTKGRLFHISDFLRAAQKVQVPS